jgi:hypothetical protein
LTLPKREIHTEKIRTVESRHGKQVFWLSTEG